MDEYSRSRRPSEVETLYSVISSVEVAGYVSLVCSVFFSNLAKLWTAIGFEMGSRQQTNKYMNPLFMRQIRQGGMGFAISDENLAKTIALLGQIGTLSGVALERVMAERLKNGDPGGHVRRALAHFPYPEMSELVLKTFFAPDQSSPNRKRGIPTWSVNPSVLLISLCITANFAMVWLAKEGHSNPITINYLEKIAMPHMFAITGAVFAEVDAITMGAGIPRYIPDVISALLSGKPLTYEVPVIGAKNYEMRFDPASFFGKKLPELKQPDFFPIIASDALAKFLAKELRGRVSGFVVEENTAGGHNAPPRKLILDEQKKPLPIYGEKDVVDYGKIRDLGLPFWIGGSYASPEGLKLAQSKGAVGIQAGSIFALCYESGLRDDLKRTARELGFKGLLNVLTDMRISPTGYPFKVALIPGTIAELIVYKDRKRVCDQRVLVSLYAKADGTIGYRCPSEPIESYLKKGGKLEDTVGRGCVCNGLESTAGLRPNEPALVTLGDDLSSLRHLMANEKSPYSAKDVITWLLS